MLISPIFRGQIKVEDPEERGILQDMVGRGAGRQEVWRMELSSMLDVSERSHKIRAQKTPQKNKPKKPPNLAGLIWPRECWHRLE